MVHSLEMDITVTERVTLPITIDLPIEPLWTIEAVASMLGTSINAVRQLLYRNKALLHDPLYITQGKRKHRVIDGNEIKLIQSKRLKGPGLSNYLSRCKGGKRGLD